MSLCSWLMPLLLQRQRPHFIYTPYNKMEPWILVWDLDETLVTGWKKGWKPEDIIVNPRAAFIISTAVKLRRLGIVKYIFLLTNNSDEPYINASIKRLGEHIQYKGKIFDNKLINDPAVRTSIVSKSPYNPDKSLRDVNYLLRLVKSSKDASAYRILFFDDRGDHVLKKQLPLEHYIQITPPFTPGSIDLTPWERVLSFLRRPSARKTRKNRQKLTRRRRLN